MSSKIEVLRICQHCGKEFTARTTKTLYCSHRCNSAAYKAKQRELKVRESDRQTLAIKVNPFEVLKAKDFLTVKEVATLLNCSVRSVYYCIENGTINSINLGQRNTRIRLQDIHKLFEKPKV